MCIVCGAAGAKIQHSCNGNKSESQCNPCIIYLKIVRCTCLCLCRLSVSQSVTLIPVCLESRPSPVILTSAKYAAH